MNLSPKDLAALIYWGGIIAVSVLFYISKHL